MGCCRAELAVNTVSEVDNGGLGQEMKKQCLVVYSGSSKTQVKYSPFSFGASLPDFKMSKIT
jgi:hypothetical protein